MKTFTTYAEKKAKQILNLLQGYTKGIRMTAILILLLMGVNNAWADITFSGGYIYFDNSIGINQTYIQLCARQSSWTGVSTMTNISNTKLYYVANPQGSNWGGILGWVVIGNSTAKTNSNFDNWSTYGWCSNWNTYGFNSGSTYLIVPTSTSKSQSVNTSYLSGGYSALNYTQTIKTAVNGADANSKAAITVTSYNLTGNGAISSQKSASISTSAKSTTISAARTATTTLTVGAVATGYQFDGWYTAATGGTKLSTSTTYTYYPTAATTVYARFSAKQYTITYKDQGNITFSGTHANGYPTTHTYGTETTLKTASKTGYTFEGWYKESACTNKVTSLGATAYTANITLYAKWTEIVEEKFTVTISNDGNGTTTLSGEQQVGASGISVTATPKEGYRFKNWTATTGITITNTTSATTTIKASQAGTVTANFEVEPCVYFINTGNWSNVYIHAWKDGGEGTAWPGTKLTKTETIKGFDIYKYTLPAGKSYNEVIFHNNASTQTADLEWVNGKYYDFYQGKWFDRNEFEAMVSKIYFKNTLGWKNVYLYTFSTDVWVADKGVKPKNSRHDYGKMTQIENTDIFYYEISNCNFAHIAFSDADMSNNNEFWKNNAVYRSDHDYKMALFIPQKDQTPSTTNDTKYYSSGLWMKYNSTESGYNLVGGFNGWNDNADKFTAGSTGVYQFEVEMNLGASSTYEFKIKKDGIDDWFGKNTTITSTKNSNIIFVSQEGNVKITTTSAGIHIFSIDLSEGKLNLSVEYPLAKGDYRMVYIESETKGTEPYTKFHPAQSIRGITDGEKLDTVSFFINKTNGQNPAILLQRCSEIDGATITWEDIAIQYINGNGGANPVLAQAPAKKSAEVHIGNGCPAVTKDAVYNFVLEQTNTGSHKAQILAGNTHPYTGNYYIRTDGAAGGWRKYLTNPDNIMTHSQTALTHGGYDYYFCEWMLKNNNVKYVVANDYSYCVSDTLAKDDIVTDENGNLPADANVRYTWNSSTNALKRAYINGSGTIADRYLVLIGNEFLKDASGNTFPEGEGDRTGLNANETTFADMGNWLYQVDIKASEKTLVKLTANYNGKIQYFKGAADATDTIITGAENEYKFRLIYDFKTNYLLCGLTEDGEISEHISVNEAMIMRSHHELAQTFNVTNAGSIKTIKTIYGVMNFNKNTLNGAGSEHERALYWVSFPFDVNLGEAFGFGNYGEHWIMEYYDGKERAEKGLWNEPTYSYWKYITNPTNYILEAGKGYVLCLDLDLLGPDADFWDNTDDIALYFPSNDENITIDSNPSSKETKVDAWECTIERDDRKSKDSNWNIIGVPSYANISDFSTKIDDVNFYYQYNAADNSYISQEATTFNTMHAYMVQFAGTIQWAYKTVAPAQMAARKQSAGKDQYTLRLALQQEDTQCDHTFIRLQEDNATAEFDMNYDLCKIINSGANIYSMIGNVEVAANVLPVEERVIPIGLDIEEDGNYTFAMPDGTDGITAILIDYETGTETNLLLADYTVELNAGIDNERFALRVRPNHVATEVENTILTDGNDNAKKYIIDGALYLLRDGKLYDAQGRMIQQ